MTKNTTSKRLYSSMLWFAAFAALSSLLLTLNMWQSWRELDIRVVLATVVSSILFWWLFIVRPQRASILRGVLVGILSGICALTLFMMWLLVESFVTVMPAVIHHADVHFTQPLPILILAPLLTGYLPALLVSLILGCVLGSAGGLLAGYLHCSVLPRTNTNQQIQEPLLHDSQIMH